MHDVPRLRERPTAKVANSTKDRQDRDAGSSHIPELLVIRGHHGYYACFRQLQIGVLHLRDAVR